MSNLIPDAVAKALKEARRLAFEANQNTSKYADGINDLANENDGGIMDLADLAAENDGAIVALAEYLDNIEERLSALENR